jgi:hypothetical protein
MRAAETVALASLTDAGKRVEELRKELAAAIIDADASRDGAARAEVTAAELRERLDKLGYEIEVVRREIDAINATPQAVQNAGEELRRVEAAGKARGRLRRAWDGWRGR